MYKVWEIGLGAESGPFKATLWVEGDTSPEVLKQFFLYHWDEFKKDEVVGLVQASRWLENRKVNHRLTPAEGCGLLHRCWTRFVIWLVRTALEAE